jgi:hypothetical protein
MKKAIRTIMKSKYSFHHIYIHNFGNFDSLFMLDALSSLGKFDFIRRDNKIIRGKLTFDTLNTKGKELKRNKRKSIIYFYDSLLILNSSLNALSTTYKVDNPKISFPIFFLNEDKIDFTYEGEVPAYKYFPKANTPEFTLDDYNSYKSNYKT